MDVGRKESSGVCLEGWRNERRLLISWGQWLEG